MIRTPYRGPSIGASGKSMAMEKGVKRRWKPIPGTCSSLEDLPDAPIMLFDKFIWEELPPL